MLDFCKGDREAFQSLVRRNQGIVFRLAFRYLSSRADAEDIAQDVFLRVYRSADRYVPSAKFTTWIYRITVNACLNRLRSRRTKRTVSLEAVGGEADGPMEPEETPTETPAEKLQREELEQKVTEVIARLPETQRTAVLLRRFDELSYEEIAEVMETTVAAVKSLLARARHTLKDLLSKHL
jgi:RNA polymerase sigma-70 factor (ECF subfamily)